MGAKEDAEEWRQLIAADPMLAASKPPQPSTGEAVARGALQGVTSGWGDELAARIEQGASKVPGLRSVAQLMQPDGAPRIDDPNVTYEERRDYKRGQNAAAREAHPVAYTGSEIGGGLAQAAIPGVGQLGKGANVATRLAGAAASGALSGAGASNAESASDVAKDALVGAGTGAAVGLAGEGVRKLVKGAPARVEDRNFKSLGEDTRQTIKTKLGDQRDRVMEVLKEPEIRSSLGNPGKMLDATERGLNDAGAGARKILSTADQAAAAAAQKGAGSGGMRVMDVTVPLYKLRTKMVENSEHPAAVAALDRIIDQFRSGIGRDNNALVPSGKVRDFLTQQIQRPAFAKGLHADAPPAQEALREASGVMKDAIDGYVRKNLGNTAADTMGRLNDRITAYSVIQSAAQEQAARGAQAPGAMTSIARALAGHKAEGIGGAIGYAVGGPVIGIAGAAAGSAAKRALPKVDEALASSAGQKLGRGVANAGPRALSPAVMDAISAGDPKRAIQQMGAEVYSE